MDIKTKTEVLDLLPVRYNDEQKDGEMIERLLKMCGGNIEKLRRYLKKFPQLFEKERFDLLYSRYNKVYSDMIGHYPDKSHSDIFGDVTHFLFEDTTKASARKNRVPLKLFMSMISRKGYLPSRPKPKSESKIKYGVQTSLRF